ncbi:MAG: hypothetical protein L7F78_07790 [Syntrophales bacterium LBB04]|nr:hypothetical protein [Syntrophales bacterium LBB04]
MRTTSYFTGKYYWWLLATVFLGVFEQILPAHGAGPALVQPLEGVSMQAKASVSLEPYEIRKGPIALSPGILPQSTGEARQARIAVSGGDTAALTFFPDVTYQITIDSVTHCPDGTMAIAARLEGHVIGTVVLTIGPDGFLITVQDLNRAVLYRATGDTRANAGMVTEIDVTKVPPVIR